MPEQLLSLLGTNLVDFLVYGAIALVVLVGVCKCIYPVFRNGSLLNRAVAKLEKTAGNNQRPPWREPRFLGRALRGEWQKFLLNAGQLDVRGMPCDIEDYINEDSVIDKPGHSQLAELIPSLLTSLGILGTFIGLMEGLTSVNFSDAQGTMDSIPLLLTGMRFAFATSVAGITCSLLFNMFNRMAAGRANRALDNFEDAFYELAMPRPLQPEVQLLCQKQDEDARMARLAESVGNHVAASLEMALGRAMSPLTQSLDTFIKGATQEQVEGVRRIVGQFVQQMNTSLNGQMTALGETMNIVNQGQLQTQQNLQSTLSAARAMAEDARNIQLASSEIAKRMRELSEEMQAMREERSNALGVAESSGLNLANQLEELTASLARMQQAVDTLTGELDGQQAETLARPVYTPDAGAEY